MNMDVIFIVHCRNSVPHTLHTLVQVAQSASNTTCVFWDFAEDGLLLILQLIFKLLIINNLFCRWIWWLVYQRVFSEGRE